MVCWEQDNLDKQFNFDDLYSHMQNVKITVYTGRTYYAESVCFDKRNKVYSITTKRGEYVDFKKSAVLCIEDI